MKSTIDKPKYVKDGFSAPEDVWNELDRRAAETGNKSLIIVKALRRYFGWDDAEPKTIEPLPIERSVS